MALRLEFSLLLVVVSDILAASDVTDAIGSFQSDLKRLFCDGLSVGGERCDGQHGVQNFINSFHEYFDRGTEDVSNIVQQVIDRVDNELNLRASFLNTMRNAINASCNSFRRSSYSEPETLSSFNDLYFAGNQDRFASLPPDIAFDSVYGQEVSLTKSTYRLPNNVDYTREHIQRDATVSHMLEETMVNLHDTHCVDRCSVLHFISMFLKCSTISDRSLSDGMNSYCSMYFGTMNGLFRVFPGTENSKTIGHYNSYDPRQRP